MIFGILILLATIILLAYEWRDIPFGLKLPLITYSGSYTVTTLIGASMLGGLVDKSFPLSVLQKFYINTSLLPEHFDIGYWILLYGALLIPIWIVLFANRLFLKGTSFKMQWLNQSVSPVAFSFICLPFILYFSASIISIRDAGFFKLMAHLDYKSSILFRYQLMAQFNQFFYGMAYFVLPVFSHIALYQWSKYRSLFWGLTFIFLVGFISLFYIMIVMKGVLLIYLVSLIIGSYTLKIFRSFYSILIILGTVLIVLTIYQSLILGNWQWIDSLTLIIFRISSNFPFFYYLYPKIIPFSGIYIPAFTPPPHENIIVFTYMHPSIDWVIGSVTGSSALMSYTQGGFGFAFFTIFCTGFLIYLISRLYKNQNGPLQYALFIQCLIFLYYLTQISFQASFISSFGIIYGLLTIFVLWVISSIFDAALGSAKQQYILSTTK